MAKRKNEEDSTKGAGEPSAADLNSDAADKQAAADTAETASEPRPEPPELDRARLGALLREGQRFAQHVKTRVAIPELHGWAQAVQHFINEFGL